MQGNALSYKLEVGNGGGHVESSACTQRLHSHLVGRWNLSHVARNDKFGEQYSRKRSGFLSVNSPELIVVGKVGLVGLVG